jgi:hypothetical protein
MDTFQVLCGDPDNKLFMCQSDVDRWRTWFKEWKHLRIVAFICEDMWWWESSDRPLPEPCAAIENIVRQWLVDSSLQRFEMWSGADSIQLSPQFQVEYARFHAFDRSESTRHRHLFERDETTGAWTLLPSTNITNSAITSQFREEICAKSCWICETIEEAEDPEDVDTAITFWNEMKQENWSHRTRTLRPWSRLDSDCTYNLPM